MRPGSIAAALAPSVANVTLPGVVPTLIGPTARMPLDAPEIPFAEQEVIPRRVFAGRSEPLLRVAARLLAEHGASGGRGRLSIDLRRVLVALPGARAGRRLVELLVEEAERRERVLVPPDVTTVGSLPERAYRPASPAPEGSLATVAWTAALRSLPSEAAAALRARGIPDDPEESWEAVARILRSLDGVVGSAGVSFRQVSAACRNDESGYSDEERWRAMATVQERYLALVREHGRLDREEARREVLVMGEARFEEEVWLVGAVDLPPIVRRFLLEADHAVPPVVVLPASKDEADLFDEIGTVRPDAWEGEGIDAGEERIRLVGGPREQADAVAEFLAALDGRLAAEQITVGTPDPEVGSYVAERLEEEGVPVRTATGRPAERSAPARFLDAAARFLERREYESFCDLVRHPAVDEAIRDRMGDRAARERSFPALLDEYQAAHLPARMGRGSLPSGGERKGFPLEPSVRGLRDAVDELLAPLARRPAHRRLSGWVEPIRETLTRVFGGGPLERHDPVDREIIEVATRIGGILEEMGGLPSALDRPTTAWRAVRFLLSELGGSEIPPEPDRAAVELLGWLELALDDAPAVLVTGVNEPHLPTSVTSDPFLPHSLRRRLGLLDNETRRARDLLWLRMILEGRDAVVLIVGRRDGEGNPLRPSRLLLTGPPPQVADRLLAFLREGRADGRAPGGPGEDDRQTVAPAAFPLPPEPVLEDDAVPDRIAVTDFRRLLADPYVYALERVLRLEAAHDRARELDPGHFGTLAHEVLKVWGEGPGRNARSPEAILEALEEALLEESRRRFGTRPLPAVRLQLEQLRVRLRAFAEWQAERARDGWEVAAVEAAPVGEGVRFEVDGAPILLRGRIDRVDRHAEREEWVLLDYKTGDQVRPPDRTHRRGRGRARRWVDLQLPLYRHLARGLRTPDGEPLLPRSAFGSSPGTSSLHLGYVALPRERAGVRAHLADWSVEELAEADETAREVVRLLRANRFEYREHETRARAESPLAPLLGRGVLHPAAEDPGGDRDEHDG